MDSPWKNEAQAAKYLGLHKDSLRRRRRLGKAPPHKRMGQAVLYNVADLKRYKSALSLKEAATYLGVHYETLALWNRQGEGPPCHKIGRRYAYQVRDLDEFERTA